MPRWLKILLVLFGLGLLGMCAVAGAGIYFVSKNVNMTQVPAADALKQFEEARARFKDQPPLIEFDLTSERVTQMRNVAEMPDAPTKASSLVIMAWDPTDERIVNLTIPLWVLSLGDRKIDMGVGAESFDLRRLNIDVHDLQRIGPALLVDMKSPSGDRALIWTQ